MPTIAWKAGHGHGPLSHARGRARARLATSDENLGVPESWYIADIQRSRRCGKPRAAGSASFSMYSPGQYMYNLGQLQP